MTKYICKRLVSMIPVILGISLVIFGLMSFAPKTDIYNQLDKIITETNGGKYLIPGFTMGAPECTYPGVYEYADETIDLISRKYFPGL